MPTAKIRLFKTFNGIFLPCERKHPIKADCWLVAMSLLEEGYDEGERAMFFGNCFDKITSKKLVWIWNTVTIGFCDHPPSEGLRSLKPARRGR